MAAPMNRRLRGKTVPVPTSRGDQIISLDELLAAPSPLPDESPEEVAQLRAAILADLAPATALPRVRRFIGAAITFPPCRATDSAGGGGSPPACQAP